MSLVVGGGGVWTCYLSISIPCVYNKSNCYIAGNFFSTARGLIGYCEVTWHLTMKLFPAKLSERSTFPMTSEGNNAMLPANVHRWPPLQRGLMNFQLQNFQLYNKSWLNDWSLGKQLILFPSNLNVSLVGTSRFWGNKINCLPRDQPSRNGRLYRVQFTKIIAFCPRWCC